MKKRLNNVFHWIVGAVISALLVALLAAFLLVNKDNKEEYPKNENLFI